MADERLAPRTIVLSLLGLAVMNTAVEAAEHRPASHRFSLAHQHFCHHSCDRRRDLRPFEKGGRHDPQSGPWTPPRGPGA